MERTLETEFVSGIRQKVFAIREPLSPSQWAQAYLSLPVGLHSQPGPFVPFPFQLEPLDCIAEGSATSMTLCWASQVLGKSQILSILIGWIISERPSGVVLLQPTLDSAQAWVRTKLTPMLRDTEILRGAVHTSTGRRQGDGGSTLLLKSFTGGFLVVVGSNSPAGLAAHTAKIVLCDELDRLDSGGVEGDPLAIVSRRSETFSDSFRVQVSTPTLRGNSRIETELALTDNRMWHLECLNCQKLFVLEWGHIKWDKTTGGEHLPATAMVECPHCAARLNDVDRMIMVAQGRWIATTPEAEIHLRGYRLNAFASLLPCHHSYVNRLHQWASEWLAAQKKGVEVIKGFINTVMCESWALPEAEATKPETLYARREVFPADTPSPSETLLHENVRLITCGCDVQTDRIEVETVAWAANLESWSIDYRVIRGNLQQQTIWNELGAYLLSAFRHPWGFDFKIDAACVDTGGHYTQRTYQFVASRPIVHCYGLKGKTISGAKWLERSDKIRNLFSVAGEVLKRSLYDQLALPLAGPGYCHLPACRDFEWYRQLVAEVCVIRTVNGVPRPRFELPSGKKNEALDCRVYARTAVEILRPNWRSLEEVYKSRRIVQETPAEYGPERLRQDPVTSERVTPPPAKTQQPQRRFRRPSPWGRGGIGGFDW